MLHYIKATTGVHGAHLHQAYKPCFISAVPPQAYGNVCWWSLCVHTGYTWGLYNHIGLWGFCSNDTCLKVCEDELNGPPVVALTCQSILWKNWWAPTFIIILWWQIGTRSTIRASQTLFWSSLACIQHQNTNRMQFHHSWAYVQIWSVWNPESLT